MPGTTPATTTPAPAPARPVPPWVRTLGRRHQDLSLPVHLLIFAVLLAATLSGMLWLAVVTMTLALVHEVTLTLRAPESEMVLERLGAGTWTRAILRSLLLAATFGVASEGSGLAVALYAIIAMLVHGGGLLVRAMASLALLRAPVIGVRNIGADLGLRRELALAASVRDVGSYLYLGLELAVAAGLATAAARSASDAVLVGVAVAGALLAVVVTAVVLWRVHRALTRGAATYARELFEELTAYAPEALVYMSAGKAQSGYILNQWLPALADMGKRAVIVIREESNVDPVGETSLPVVFAPQTRHVEQLVLPSVRVAFYLANAGKNVHLQREPAIKHVFLNHGDSDKSTSANPVSRVYDEVWVAGQAAIDRYHAAGVDIPAERFAIVGRPQVNGLLVGRLPDQATTYVLYAPTWEGYYQEANYSSLEVMGVQLVRTILATRPDLGVIFKPHPSTGVQRAGMRAARNEIERVLRQSGSGQHIVADDTGLSLNECFDRATVLVSDISSVVTDFLHTQRPIVISNPTSMAHDLFRTSFPTQAASYILDRDLRSLGDLLDDALGADSLSGPRSAMKTYVLGDLPDGPLRAFSDNADRVYDLAGDHADRVRNAFTISHLDPHQVG